MIAMEIDQHKLAEFCDRHKVARLSLFGSTLRGQDRPDSDVDLLVEFKPGARISLFDIGGMAMELKSIFGREVDLRTEQDLSRYFRDEIVRTAKLLYAA